MSDLRDITNQSNELRDISNKGLSSAYKSREVSIGTVTSCATFKNKFIVYLIDEHVSVDAKLTGILNDWISSARPSTGDLVLVLHKATSDAMIFAKMDDKRSAEYKDNVKSNPFQQCRHMQAQGPT